MATPALSVVVCGRNDNHHGDFDRRGLGDRLQPAFLRSQSKYECSGGIPQRDAT